MTATEPAGGRLIVSWDDLDGHVAELAVRVGREYDLILAVSRGGLIPAGMLAYRLGIRNLVTAAVALYDEDRTAATEPRFLQFPADLQLRGQRVLIVDEVWDSGRTIEAVVGRVRAAGGRPTTAVLHYKPGRSVVGIVPDYAAVATDAWVVYPYKGGR